MKRENQCVWAVLVALVMSLPSVAARGQVFWSGLLNDQWSEPLNWAGVGVVLPPPGAGLVFGPAVRQTVDLGSNQVRFVNSLILNGNQPYTLKNGQLLVGFGVNSSGTITGSHRIQSGVLLTGPTFWHVGHSAPITVDGAMAGAFGLTKLGAGVLTLAGDNTYEGSTLIEAGTLQIGSGSDKGSVRGDILNRGALVFDRSTDPPTPAVSRDQDP